MLKHAQPILILEKMGTIYPMPANKGQAIKMRRPVPFAPAMTPLVEGITPDAQKMSFEDVETSLKQYGAWLGITDVIQDTHEDPVLRTMSMLCGEQAGETKEMLTWGVLTGGTNVLYADGVNAQGAPNGSRPTDRGTLGALTGTAGVPAAHDFRLAKRILVKQRAKPITKILNPSPNQHTKYVEASYVALGHTDMEAGLRAMPGFIPVAGYGSRTPMSDYEVGTFENMRFILSPYYEPVDDGAGNDVYQMVILGQDAFGTVPLKGKNSIASFVLNPGQARAGDPLGQRGSVGWKTWWAALITNQAWMLRLEGRALSL
jgi:N4-gp56 family major capsid protein